MQPPRRVRRVSAMSNLRKQRALRSSFPLWNCASSHRWPHYADTTVLLMAGESNTDFRRCSRRWNVSGRSAFTSRCRPPSRCSRTFPSARQHSWSNRARARRESGRNGSWPQPIGASTITLHPVTTNRHGTDTRHPARASAVVPRVSLLNGVRSEGVRQRARRRGEQRGGRGQRLKASQPCS